MHSRMKAWAGRLAGIVVALWLCGAAGAAVNLNTATKDELIALPGIGPAKAQAIVDYRNQHGPFRAVEEVRRVKGIGEKLFLQIKPELTIGAAPAQRAASPGTPAAKAEPTPAKADTRAGTGAIAPQPKK